MNLRRLARVCGAADRLVLQVIDGLKEQNDDIKFVLTAVPGIHGFYEALGFAADPEAMVRYRKR